MANGTDAPSLSEADVALVFVNADSGEGFITVENNAYVIVPEWWIEAERDSSGDRNDLSLWHDGDTLIEQVAATSWNVVVVIHSVGPVDMERWIDIPTVKAVLWAGLPGQESGRAIVDILWGTVNPVRGADTGLAARG